MSLKAKLLALLGVLVLVLALVLSKEMPKESPEPHSGGRSTDSIEATCGTPDAHQLDETGIYPTLTYYYKAKGAYVHFSVDPKTRNTFAVSVSNRSGRTARLDEPAAYEILPCAVR